jgi:hypothetical protein
MNKVIAAVDALSFSEEQLIQYQEIAGSVNGKLVVAFLENVIGEGLPITTAFPYGGYAGYEEINWKNMQERRKFIQEKVELFHSICSNRKIDAVLHQDGGIPLNEVIRESRFADLLIVNNTTTFASLFETDPPKFVKDVLRDAQCPVLVLPSEQKRINEIVLTYNGSFSSMYAIRQFTHLFASMVSKKVVVLYVDEAATGKVKEEALLREYLRLHYKNYQVKILKGEPSFEILNYLMNNPNSIVSLGAYGRSRVSHFFHQSDATKILKTLNIPVFITHP